MYIFCYDHYIYWGQCWSEQSSQSHVSHCRVLPLGEFTVTIPEPHATLQGAVTWWNYCRDRATLQGVIIPSAILKIIFRHILFCFVFLVQFGLWQATAFVSSLVHLFPCSLCNVISTYLQTDKLRQNITSLAEIINLMFDIVISKNWKRIIRFSCISSFMLLWLWMLHVVLTVQTLWNVGTAASGHWSKCTEKLASSLMRPV